MKRAILLIAAVLMVPAGCGEQKAKKDKAIEDTAPVERVAKEKKDMRPEARAFLDIYLEEFAGLEKTYNLAFWTAATSGKKEDFDASAKAELALKMLHSNPDKYAKIQELLAAKEGLDPLDVRSLQVAELSFKGNQLPAELLEQMVTASKEIELAFNTFRGQLGGVKFSNNDLLEKLAKETDTAQRKAIWESLKQVGGAVGPKLVELAKLRNKAAVHLGYKNFWDMQIRLQEHDPAQIMKIFDELEKLTDAPFREMKEKLDGEQAARFGISPEQMMPWHYDNPFFQAAPPAKAVDLNEFYKDRKKEEIIELAAKFYKDIGLPCDNIIKNSDLYEREGKDQHAFCITIDRGADVRTLLNIKPTAEWMDTTLHEEGHAIYYTGIDRNLPYNLREASHIFTTEAIAMLFGALGKNPTWMVAYAGADEKRVEEVKGPILEQRRREQLIFARWTMVMLHFEKSMYENPAQDLNGLWWRNVERFQLLTPPPERDAPDWAAKPHFTIAPVYYHNYMLGELMAAQLRHTLAGMSGHTGPTSELSFNGRVDFGEFLKEKVFKPGMSSRWPEFVKNATGEDLTAKHFGTEVK